MKTRFLIALPLAASMIVPAMAQQSSSTQNSQQAQAATQTAPSDDTSARQPLQQDTRQGFWGKLNPFARKKYVERQLSPVRNRVNELDELTASNTKMLKDVDSRATEGIRLASNKANEADQHAVDAGNRAQMAHQTATQAGQRLQTVEQVVGKIDEYQPSTQTEIRFRQGQTALSKNAKSALDDMAQTLKDQKGYIVEVQGFAPGRGQASIQTSQAMADSVVRYLVLNHEIPVYRIFVLGMGNAPVQDANGKKTTRGGHVEITLMKNGVDQLASAGSAPAMGQGGVTGQTQQQQPAQQQQTPQQQQQMATPQNPQ
jgi:outer membrane protein OmpA-like peptidoglycan-associated protein